MNVPRGTLSSPTLCDLLGEHTTLLPIVTPDLEHVGYRCSGCAAQAQLDGCLGPPAGLRCFICGGPMDSQVGPVLFKASAAFCSFLCVAVAECPTTPGT